MSESIAEQIQELTEEARASGHKAPLRHAWASPPAGAQWSEQEWDAYWTLYERAQGLDSCAYSEAIHDKPGEDGRPPHRHRVYLAITERGTLVRTGWDYARQEAVSRITEYDTGASFVKGKHNKHAARIARDLGREDVAIAMEVAGLMNGPPAIAGLSPAQRAQQERTGITKADVAREVATAWKASDGVPAFMAALQERGLWLAQGTKQDGVPVILDHTGSTHGLRQMLGMAARDASQPAPKRDAITAFLEGAALPSLDDARVAQRAMAATSANPEQSAPEPGPVTPGPPKAILMPLAAVYGQPIPNEQTQAPAGVDAQFAQPSQDDAPAGIGATITEGDAGPGMSFYTDTIDGPGEPPRPGASIQENQRWREKLFEYEEKKEKAALRQQAALAAENNRKNQGGQNHAHVPAQTVQAPANTGIYFTGFQARITGSAEGRYSANEQPVAGGNTRDQGQGPGGGQFIREHDRTAAGRAAEPDTGNPVGPGRHREEPASAGAGVGNARAHARQALACRAAEVRLEAGVGAQSDAVTALRRARKELDPAWRERRDAHGRFRADRDRITRVLATHPHPDPASRDLEAWATAYAGKITDGYRERRNAMNTAQAEATAALTGRSRGTKFMAAIGIVTPEQHRAMVTVENALRLTDDEERLRPTPSDYADARTVGTRDAYTAQAQTKAWEAVPDVAQAIEQDRLNQAVDAAANVGDPAIARALKAGDPDAARQVIQAREEAERQQQEARERRMGIQPRDGTPGPEPLGPM